RRSTLEPVTTRERRLPDDQTVLVFQTDNFGDIGTALPVGAGAGALTPALMLLLAGGGVACLYFGTLPAVQDVIDGARNIRVLRDEQRKLRVKYGRVLAGLLRTDAPTELTREQRRALRNLAMRMGVSRTDLRSEVLERVAAGCLIAPGTACSGVGTLLWPGFLVPKTAGFIGASSLLTGLVGNIPVALYGAITAASSALEYLRIRRRIHCVRAFDLNRTWGDPEADVNDLVMKRLHRIRSNALLTGITSAGLGAGGLVTVFTFFGYALLLPFAIGRAAAEFRARRKISYTRRLYAGETDYTSRRDLVSDLIYMHKTHVVLKALKVQTRARYPWGREAPVPLNYLLGSLERVRHWRDHVTPSPATQVRRFFRRYRKVQLEWLERKQVTLRREQERLRAHAPRDGRHAARLDAYVEATERLDAHIRALRADRRAVAQSDEARMYGADAHEWLVRAVGFFVENGMFRTFAKTLLEDPRVRPALASAVREKPKRKQLTVDANDLVAALAGDQRRALRRRGFLDALYGDIERDLLLATKTRCDEMARELIDMLVMRLWLSHRPEHNPMRRVPPSTAVDSETLARRDMHFPLRNPLIAESPAASAAASPIIATAPAPAAPASDATSAPTISAPRSSTSSGASSPASVGVSSADVLMLSSAAPTLATSVSSTPGWARGEGERPRPAAGVVGLVFPASAAPGAPALGLFKGA
ncbi:MAG TPA: hypothetical protein VFH51_18245, partial [Myxococcota bacterium]|nr:hypothetical protein [Myxococcota bacterium]